MTCMAAFAAKNIKTRDPILSKNIYPVEWKVCFITVVISAHINRVENVSNESTSVSP